MSSAKNPTIRPVILCGGAGTRLWPLSRPDFPKQFLKLTGDESLLQQTLKRLSGTGFSAAIIVSGEDQGTLIANELGTTDTAIEAVLLEPAARNTAGAAGLAAAWLERSDGDELMLLMPSDHVIEDTVAFRNAIETAIPHAARGAIVTFGAEPTEPNTQYGYIEADTGGAPASAYPIAKFHEKPGLAQAAEYLRTGRFFWNCGIFLARASTVLEEMERLLPSSMAAIRDAVAASATDGLFVRPLSKAFSLAENISIDHAIMERTDRGIVVPVQMKWSDIGAWDAVWKLGGKDQNGNVTRGDVTMLDSRNSLIRADGKAKIAVLGLEDICVIAVDDAVFVAPLDRVAEIKDLLATARAGETKTSSAKSEEGRAA